MQQGSLDRINTVIYKIKSCWKNKAKGFDFEKKCALLKWMNYVYARRNYNYRNILCETILVRKTLWQMVNDQKKVNAMKIAGSTKKSGRFANKKRKRLSLPQFTAVDEA
jgi:hypothetical protein